MLVIFDDILIYNRSCKDHGAHLHRVFQVLATHELYINRKKCQVGNTQLEFLDQLLSENGVQVEEAKIDEMLK